MVLGALLSAAAHPQSFDVASIKLGGVAGANVVKREPSKIFLNGVTLAKLIWVAYDIRAYQLITPTGKMWFEGTKLPPPIYQGEAHFQDGTSDADLRAMLRNLLVERWSLKVHEEERELDALVFEAPAKLPKNIQFPDADPHPFSMAQMQWGPEITTLPTTMRQLLDRLSGMIETPLIDRTGWRDKAVVVKWPVEIRGGGMQGYKDALRDSLYSMGFKVSKERVKSKVLVVDSVGKLVEN